jgi:hypothetical protein
MNFFDTLLSPIRYPAPRPATRRPVGFASNSEHDACLRRDGGAVAARKKEKGKR